jgi:hypothetical protein
MTTGAYGGIAMYLHVFLFSAKEGSDSSASYPGCIISEKKPPVPIGQKVGFAPELVLDLDCPSHSLITIPTHTRYKGAVVPFSLPNNYSNLYR